MEFADLFFAAHNVKTVDFSVNLYGAVVTLVTLFAFIALGSVISLITFVSFFTFFAIFTVSQHADLLVVAHNVVTTDFGVIYNCA